MPPATRLTQLTHLTQLWANSPPSPSLAAWLAALPANTPAPELLDALRLDQQLRWKTPAPLRAEEYLQHIPPLPNPPDWQLELVAGEWLARSTHQPLTHPELIQRFPDLAELPAHLVALTPDADPLTTIDHVCDRFEQLHRENRITPRLEFSLANLPANHRSEGFLQLLKTHLECLQQADQTVSASQLCERFPQYLQLIHRVCGHAKVDTNPVAPANANAATGNATQPRPAQTDQAATDPETLPEFIGPYRIIRLLGKGGFGRVLLAQDTTLNRHVALKQPLIPAGKHNTSDAVARVNSFRREALLASRMTSGLEQTRVVQVLHILEHQNLPVLVMQYIPGSDLSQKLIPPEHAATPSRTLPPAECVRILRQLAEILQTTHEKGVFHRDLKPRNVLVDQSGQLWLTDFGLAMCESDWSADPLAGGGTLLYMAPEQLQGESNKVDGRVDIWSLGVMLYQMLSGHLPYTAKSRSEMIQLIHHREHTPLRQRDRNIPDRLALICDKCLRRSLNKRYSSIAALLDDLELWDKPLPNDLQPPVTDNAHTADSTPAHAASTTLAPATPQPSAPAANSAARSRSAPDTPPPPPAATPTASLTTSLSAPSLRIRPRGLQSYTEEDRGFFLKLLPGDLEASGLPDTIHFWLERLGIASEITNPGSSSGRCSSISNSSDTPDAFAVGLIHGASGCGKSSFIKAGLLPLLPRNLFERIYLEATPANTESQLFNRLRKLFPEIPKELPLPEVLRRIQDGEWLPPHKRLLIVIDQFEQWLDEHSATNAPDLAFALRHCGNQRLQAILLVREEYWTKTSEFITQQLDLSLDSRSNDQTLPLFNQAHARNVLAAFGQFFGKLPEDPRQWSPEAEQFLDQAISDLSTDRRVIPVHLAVFAQMFRELPWTPAELQRQGGAAGAGVRFLQQQFSGPEAPERHRRHLEAAQRLLEELLPPPGSVIRGHMQSRKHLEQVFRNTGKGNKFTDLLQILENDLKLITRTDLEPDSTASGSPGTTTNPAAPAPADSTFMLTHDFLVPSLRTWIDTELQKSPSGRALAKLRSRERLYTDRKEDRQLPSLLEYLQIRRYVPRTTWTPAHRELMLRAKRRHSLHGATLAFIVCIAIITGLFVQSRITANRAKDLAGKIADLKTSELASGLNEMLPLREYALPKLRQLYEGTTEGSEARLHLAIARLKLGDAPGDLLPEITDLILECRPEQLLPFVALLKPWAALLIPELKTALQNTAETPGRRLHAACLLANWQDAEAQDSPLADPQIAEFLAGELATQNSQNVRVANQYLEVLRPQAPRIAVPLVRMFLDADVVAGTRLFSLLTELRDDAISQLHDVLDQKLLPPWPDQPLNSTWQEPSPDVQTRITSSQGIITDRFAMCLDIPLSQLLPLVESLRASGYRPTRLRPHAGADSVDPRMSAVWTRDGGKWELQTGVKPDELPQPNSNAERNGLLLADLSLIPGDQPTSGWLTLWNEAATPDEQRRCVADAVAGEFVRLRNGLRGQNFNSQLSQQVHNNYDGPRRYSGVFSNIGQTSDLLLCWAGFDRIDKPQRDIAVAHTWINPLLDYKGYLRKTEELIAANPTDQSLLKTRAIQNCLCGRYAEAIPDLDMFWNAGDRSEWLLRFRAFATANQNREKDALECRDLYLNGDQDWGNRFAVEVITAAFLGDMATCQCLFADRLARCRTPGDFCGLAEYYALGSAPSVKYPEGNPEFAEEAVKIIKTHLAQHWELSGYVINNVSFIQILDHPDIQELCRQMNVASVFDRDRRPDLETRLVCGQRPEDILRQVRELTNDHWRPVTIARYHPDSSHARMTFTGDSQIRVLMERPIILEDASDALALKQATAAVALLRLDAPTRVWPLLQDSPDPSVRSYFLHRLPRYGLDAQALIKQLAVETDAGRRRALIQGLGELAAAGLITDSVKPTLISDLLSRYGSDPDSGVHGMCEWTLRQLGAEQQLVSIQQEFATGAAVGDRRWYLTKTGGETQEDTAISLAIVDANQDFRMGSPLSEKSRGADEKLHRRRINRVYAIGMHEITVAQFRRSRRGREDDRRYTGAENSTANMISWYDAAEFCNWLSKEEGIPQDQWCYDPDQRFADGMRLRPNYLQLTGYRLATEAEWEHACRSGTSTARFYGSGESLLDDYAWYRRNSHDAGMIPVATLRPNAYGLYGVYGHAWEWCQDAYVRDFRAEMAWLCDVEQLECLHVVDSNSRVLRGGSFASNATDMRSAYRSSNRPDGRNFNDGFRVSRTYPLAP